MDSDNPRSVRKPFTSFAVTRLPINERSLLIIHSVLSEKRALRTALPILSARFPFVSHPSLGDSMGLLTCLRVSTLIAQSCPATWNLRYMLAQQRRPGFHGHAFIAAGAWSDDGVRQISVKPTPEVRLTHPPAASDVQRTAPRTSGGRENCTGSSTACCSIKSAV